MFADLTFIGVTLSALAVTLIVVVWVLIALLPASIAKSKGHSFILWFIVSLFFWWITLFVVFFLPNRKNPTAAHSY